jgi:hypothetical protein
MVDHRSEWHFLRLLIQKNTNTEHIPQEPDGMVDQEDISIFDNWTEWVAEDLWVLGDEAEISMPVDLEFALWDEDEFSDTHDNRMGSYHGWTDESRWTCTMFGWLPNHIRVQVNR